MKYTRDYEVGVKRKKFISFADAQIGVGYRDGDGVVRVKTDMSGYLVFNRRGRFVTDSPSSWPSDIASCDEVEVEITLKVRGE